MALKLKPFIGKYGGVILGAFYGLGIRLLFGYPAKEFDFSFFSLFSITFIWVVPFVIGIIPMIFARKKQLKSVPYRVLSPAASVLLFFIFCFITRIEDLVCILIIGAPFIAGASLGGALFSLYILNYRHKKGILYSVLFVPFILGAIEEQFKNPSETFDINTSIIINTSPQNIWSNVIRVKQITNSEYNEGFFNFAGIPRPLYAELNADKIGAIRIGHFDGGLQFKETVNYWEPNKKVSFDIHVIPSSIRSTIFDKHILKGGHFKFLNATYQIEPINTNHCKLTLSSSYKLDTKINRYASFWGNWMLEDFQERLLAVIKKRCDE